MLKTNGALLDTKLLGFGVLPSPPFWPAEAVLKRGGSMQSLISLGSKRSQKSGGSDKGGSRLDFLFGALGCGMGCGRELGNVKLVEGTLLCRGFGHVCFCRFSFCL